MKKSDLFVLIKSLTINEKRNFKAYSNRQAGDRAYKRLYHLLDGMDEYDAKIVGSHFPKEAGLHVLKKYLFDSVLESLQVQVKSIQGQLQSELNNIQRLYELGLYVKMKGRLKSTKVVALMHEQFELYLLLLEKEELLLTKQVAKKRENLMDALGEERARILAIVLDVHESKKIYRKFYFRIKKSPVAISKEEDAQLAKLADSDSMKEEERLSATARIYILASKLIISRMHNNIEKQYQYAKALVEVFDNNKPFIESKRHRYISEMITLLQACFYVRKYTEFITIYDKLQKLEDKGLDEEIQIFTYATPPYLRYHIAIQKDHNKGRQLLEEFKEQYDKRYKAAMNAEQKGIFLVNVMIQWMSLKDFKQAKKFSSYFTALPKHHVRNDISRMHRIFSLLIFFDGEHTDREWIALLSLAKSAYGIVKKKRKKLPQWEWEMVRFFSRLPKDRTQKEKVCHLLNELHQNIQVLAKDEYEARSMQNFNFQNWPMIALQRWKVK